MGLRRENNLGSLVIPVLATGASTYVPYRRFDVKRSSKDRGQEQAKLVFP